MEDMSVVILGNKVFKAYSYRSEAELEKFAVEHSQILFGKDCHFFNLKLKITSKAGTGCIPDGYLVDVNRGKFFIIEVELSSHNIFEHINNQLSKFKIAMENPEAKRQLSERLADSIATKGLNKELYDAKYLNRIMNNMGIYIIIDNVTPQLEEVFQHLSRDGTEVKAIPFETYANSEEKIHKFTTFTKEEFEQEAKKWTFKWTTVPISKHLEKAEEGTQEVFKKLSEQICSLPNAKQVTRKGWTTYQTSPLKNFCTIKILKDGLEVNLKADKANFKDPKGIARDIKRTPAWTFDKVFNVNRVDEVEYAMGLIKQAFDCICPHK